MNTELLNAFNNGIEHNKRVTTEAVEQMRKLATEAAQITRGGYGDTNTYARTYGCPAQENPLIHKDRLNGGHLYP